MGDYKSHCSSIITPITVICSLVILAANKNSRVSSRALFDENYKNEREKDEERESERKREKENAQLDTEEPESASRRINREPAEILPVLDPLIVGPEGADQEVRCLRNPQIVLHVYVDGFSGCSHVI